MKSQEVHTAPPKLQARLGELASASPVLARLFALSLPAKTAYHVAKLARLVEPEANHERTQREAWLTELGEERDATKEELEAGVPTRVLAVKPELVEEFLRRVNELRAIEIEIAWAPINIRDLEGATLSGPEIVALGPLLVD